MKTDIKTVSLSLPAVALSYLLALAAALAVTRMSLNISLIAQSLLADLAATIVIFIASLFFNNSSLYDPYWSIAPPFLFLYWYREGYGGETPALRLALIMAVCLLWSVRLTSNWFRDWPGLGHEDWRYRNFRAKAGRLYWLVSFLAIHLFPTVMVFFAALPAYFVITGSNGGLSLFDLLAPAAGLGAVWIQWVSDGQMRRHRQSSRRNEPMKKGLWKYSRHPNYFGEILFWFSLFLFAMAADPLQYWTGLGTCAMVLLFTLYSIPAMENRQLLKRPAYIKIQESVSELIPWPKRIDPVQGISLMNRKRDIAYVVIFLLFACTSFITDSLNGFQEILSPDSASPVEQVIYRTYAVMADPNLIINPPVVRVGAFISAVIWGPLYIFFVICFIRGWNIIRNFGFYYGAALSSSMFVYMIDGLYGVNASPRPLFFFAVNIAYFLVPLSMIFRMRKEKPFPIAASQDEK